ncbi:hypothetical protein K438DRAFT_37893 [Mycena galopus ATCC 62051]|nr:hypothetical protein K438DRAFT_37893 [Mycena galopus ATCC 62051]
MADSTPIPAAEIAALIAGVKQIFATSFIGFSLATTIYGISILQVYLYYRNYHADRASLKSMVALLFLLDTLSTIFVAHSLYTFYVLNFEKSPAVDLIIPWSFSTEKLLVTLITFIAQCFYAHAIWKVTVNKFVAGSIIFLAVTCLALGIVTTVEIFTIFNVIGTRKFSILSGLVQGLAALNDVIITISMIFYLNHNRSGLPSTTMFVDKLILYAVSRGVLTAVCQILFLVTNVALPGSTYWQPWHQMVGKRIHCFNFSYNCVRLTASLTVYVNSVYATLNVRSTFTKSEVQLGTTPEYKFNSDAPRMPGESVQLSMDSSNHPKPITFAPTKATTDSSALTSSGGE